MKHYWFMNKRISFFLFLIVAGLLTAETVQAQGTAFTYQGRLNAAGGAANGSYDLTFEVYDAITNGSPVSSLLTNSPTAVSNGLFTVTVDFGSGVFNGNPRWLEVGVRTNGNGLFNTLSPRQALLPAPYAIAAGNLVGAATNQVNSAVQGATNAFLGTVTNVATGQGYVTSSITNGLASITYVNTATNGFVTATITNGLATTNYINTATNNFGNTVAVSLTNANNQFIGAFTGNGGGLTNLNFSSLTNNAAQYYVSTNIPLTTNGVFLYWTNQLTFAPSNALAYFVCISPDALTGHQPGDVISGVLNGSTTAVNMALVPNFNGTNITLTCSAAGFWGRESSYYMSPVSGVGAIPVHPTSFTNFAARVICWTPGANSILTPTNGMVGSDVTNAINGVLNNFGNATALNLTNTANNFAGTFSSNVLTTNQSGVWLIHANGTKSFYGTNLLAAYQKEIPSDLLYMDNGTYSGGFIVSNTVHWKGQSIGVWDWNTSQIDGGVIITNGIRVWLGSSNSTFENFGLEASDLPLGTSMPSATIANNQYINLIVGDVSGTGGHNAFITGSGNLVEAMKCYNGGNHGILAIGCSNTIIKDCISLGNRANSYVIKADPTQQGSLGNVTLENCYGDGSILVQCNNAAQSPGGVTTMANVLLKNVTLDNSLQKVSTVVGVWLNADANCYIKNFYIDGLNITGYSPSDHDSLATLYSGTDGTNYGTFSNIQIINSSINNPYTNCQALLYVGSLPDNSQIKVANCTVNGMNVNGSGAGVISSLFASSSNSFWGLAGGAALAVTPDIIVNEYATNGYLYLFYTNDAGNTAYSVKYSNIQVGDPIWVTNGAAAGVWKYVGNGVEAGGSPVPAPYATNGNSYIQLAYTGTNGNYTPPSQFFHGKVLAVAPVLGQYQPSVVDLTGTAAGIAAMDEALSKEFLTGGAGNIPTTLGETQIGSYHPADIPMLTHAWATSNGVYFGIFGTAQNAFWVNSFSSGWSGPQLQITATTPYGSLLLVQTNAWQ